MTITILSTLQSFLMSFFKWVIKTQRLVKLTMEILNFINMFYSEQHGVTFVENKWLLYYKLWLMKNFMFIWIKISSCSSTVASFYLFLKVWTILATDQDGMQVSLRIIARSRNKVKPEHCRQRQRTIILTCNKTNITCL